MDTIPITTRKSVCKDIDPATLHRLYHEEGMPSKYRCAVRDLHSYGEEIPGACAQGAKASGEGEERCAPSGDRQTGAGSRGANAAKAAHPTKIELKGRTARFEVDLDAGSLYVRGAVFEMLLAKEEVEQFIWELVEAYEAIPRRAEPVADGAKT